MVSATTATCSIVAKPATKLNSRRCRISVARSSVGEGDRCRFAKHLRNAGKGLATAAGCGIEPLHLASRLLLNTPHALHRQHSQRYERENWQLVLSQINKVEHLGVMRLISWTVHID
jgi:hypothetical protein